MSQPLAIRKHLGRYELVSRLATGGMAEVWLARAFGAKNFEKTVVIKTILPHLADDPDFVRMFINEAVLAASLEHPNVVQIFDLGSIDGSFFIAMEHISGRTLRQIERVLRQRSEPMPLWFALHVSMSVCDALECAHGQVDEDGRPCGVVHRDVTPENIMVSFAGVTKVLDFGIAKAESAVVVTQGGRLKGKFAYLAPEQIDDAARGGPSGVDGRSDIYSFGVVMYEMLTSKRPFTGGSDLELLKQVLAGAPKRADEVSENVPPELATIIAKAMARSPAERHQDAAALRADLERFAATIGPLKTTRQVGHFVRELFGVKGRPEPRAAATRSATQAETSGATDQRSSPPAPAPPVGTTPGQVLGPPDPGEVERSEADDAISIDFELEEIGDLEGDLEVLPLGAEPKAGPEVVAATGEELPKLVDSSENAVMIEPTPVSQQRVVGVKRSSRHPTPQIVEGKTQDGDPDVGSAQSVETGEPSSWDLVLQQLRTPAHRGRPADERGATAAEAAPMATPGGSSTPAWDALIARVATGAAEREGASDEPADRVPDAGEAEALGRSAEAGDRGSTESDRHMWDSVLEKLRPSRVPAAEKPGFPPQRSAQSAEQEFDEGLALVREGRLEEAEARWQRAVERDPENRKFRSNLRRLHRRLGRDERER